MKKLLIFLLLSCCSLFAAKKPNVVFILIDDMGYMDVSPNNPDTFYDTPNIQRLADSGMKFTNGYAANPVCSPTRYSIMTGKYPSRLDATNFFSGKRSGKYNPAPLFNYMPDEEVTLAEIFKKNGYKTCFAGKWHLGHEEKMWPEFQGFDVNIGGWSAGHPKSFFSPYKNPRLKDGEKGEHLPARLTSDSIKFIEENKDNPFLLYLSFYSVHTPLQGRKNLVEKYKKKAESIKGEEFADEEQVWPGKSKRKVRILQKHATYAAMVEAMDEQVGRILDKLKELKINDNTIVCFTSDNGGLSTSEGSPTSNLPLRGGKGWVYEGGIREPFLIKWPGVVKAGSTCDTPVVSIDFLPTLAEMAGIKDPVKNDGVSLVSLLKGGDSIGRKSLFWHYPHYSNQGGFPGGAIREGDWKLVERYEDGRVHLYNLASDIGEKIDLADKHPSMVDEMRKRLHNWYREVDAKFLQPKGNDIPWSPFK